MGEGEVRREVGGREEKEDETIGSGGGGGSVWNEKRQGK